MFLAFLIHWYHMAEVYAVILVWIVIPLGFFASYLFLQRHYGLFTPTASEPLKPRNREVTQNASN